MAGLMVDDCCLSSSAILITSDHVDELWQELMRSIEMQEASADRPRVTAGKFRRIIKKSGSYSTEKYLIIVACHNGIEDDELADCSLE